MATLLLVILSVAVLHLAGYGPTLLALEKCQRLPRLTAIPVVGLGSYLVLSHTLAGLGMTGRHISWFCLGTFALLALMVPRARRLRWHEVREGLAPLLVCLAATVFTAWPLLYQGHQAYLAAGNADAAFNLAVYEDLLDHPYGLAPPDSISFWPNAQFGHVFGVGYIAILISVLTGVSILELHEVTSASLVFVAPASVFLFCLLSLKVTRGKAITAMCLSALSSLVTYTFCHQSLGAMTFIALFPAVLAFWTMVLERASLKVVALCALLIAAATFGYYAALPILSLVLGGAALAALLRRRARLRTVAFPVLASAAVFFAAYPALAWGIVKRTLVEATSSRLEASLHGPEILLSFAFALTEQFLPFFWGILIPQIAWGTVFAPPEPGFFLTLALSVILFVTLIFVLCHRSASIPFEVKPQVFLLLATVCYFALRNNAYGVFKLAAWLSPLFLSVLVCGALQAARHGVVGPPLRWSVYSLLIIFGALNGYWSVHLSATSLDPKRLAGKSMAGFRQTDFADLRSMPATIQPDSRILIAVPDPVVQRWVVTYLRGKKLSVMRYLSLSPDEADASEQIAAEGALASSYVLTWAPGSWDITINRFVEPLWSNDKFQLIPIDRVRNFLVLGRGWYRAEGDSEHVHEWRRRFRWLRREGEILILRPGNERLRLQISLLAGYGKDEPDRLITLLSGNRELDRFHISGFATVVSQPFECKGVICAITLALPDDASPLPRPWGLFNKWVPKDGRRLNIAVSKIGILTESEYLRRSPPCRIDLREPGALGRELLSGVFPDRWIAREARVLLANSNNAREILIRGFVPGMAGFSFPLGLTVWVNGGTLQEVQLATPGNFAVAVELPKRLRQSRYYEVRLRPSATFGPVAGDRRRLSVRLDGLELVPCEGSRQPGARFGGAIGP